MLRHLVPHGAVVRSGLRSGLLVGLVGLLQIAVLTPEMVSNRAVVHCVVEAGGSDIVYAECRYGTSTRPTGSDMGSLSPEVDTLSGDLTTGYVLSLVPVFVLYFLAGRAARLATGRRRSGVAAASLAALVGGALYIVADVIRTLALFSPFLAWVPIPFFVGGCFHPSDCAPTTESASVGVVDEIGFLLPYLTLLVVCAALLGLVGRRWRRERDAVSYGPPVDTDPDRRTGDNFGRPVVGSPSAVRPRR